MGDNVIVTRKLTYGPSARDTRRCRNMDGMELWPGDVVVLDPTNSLVDFTGATSSYTAVKTSNTADDIDAYGIAIQHIANLAYGEIQFGGLTDLLRADGTTNIAIGDELATISTADATFTSTLGFTFGGTTVTDSGNGFTAAMVGRYIYKDEATTKYRITVRIGAGSVTITPAYREVTAATASGKVTAKGRAVKATAGKGGAFATALDAYETDDSAGVIDAILFLPSKVNAGTVTLDGAYDAGTPTITVDSADIILNLSTGRNLLVNGAAAGTTAVGIEINDNGGTLTTGILFTAATAITTAIDASDAEIGDAINIGANAIAGTNFNVSGAGAIVGVGANYGSGTLQGTGNIAISTNKFTVTGASGDTVVAGTLDVTGVVTTTTHLVVGGNLTVAGTWTIGTQLTASAGIDMNGTELVMDNAGTSSLHMSTNAQLDVNLAGTDEYVFTASSFDINANELILDADADTSITADTDDQIDVRIEAVDRLVMSKTASTFADNYLLRVGTTGDGVILNRDAILAADTVLASVLIGTVEAQAIAANSLMIANATSDGDIAAYVNKTGHSQMVFWADGSTGDTAIMAASGASVDTFIAGTKEIDYAVGALAFTKATIISTAATTLTLTPSTDVVISDAKGLIVGNAAQVTMDTILPEVEVLGTATADSSLALARFSADASSPMLILGKSRNPTIGAGTIVVADDVVGTIKFVADDGTSMDSDVASISVAIDATPGADDTPGRIIFSTTKDGTFAVTEALRIDSSQNAKFAGRIGVKATAPSATIGLGASYLETYTGAQNRYGINWIVEGTNITGATASSLVGGYFRVGLASTNDQNWTAAAPGSLLGVSSAILLDAGATGTITAASNLSTYSAIGAATITSLYGLYVDNASGAGAVTNQYGVYVADLTKGATVDYGVYVAGADTASFYAAADPAIFKGGVYGSDASGGNLTLGSTTHATEGYVLIPDQTACLKIGGTGTRASAYTNSIDIFNGTAPTATFPGEVLANGVTLFSEDVGGIAELKAMDENCNVATLSPHTPDGDYKIHSYNAKRGKTILIHIEKLLKKLAEKDADFADFFEEADGYDFEAGKLGKVKAR